MSDIYDWSLTADANAHSDDLINWAEGQPPSSVNDSARAMMQRVREYLADNGGSLYSVFNVNDQEKTTSIMLTTVSPITTYKNDLILRFKACDSNIGPTTLTVNNIGEKPVYKATDAGVVSLEGGELQAGGIYEIVYSEDSSKKDLDGWYLINPTPKTPPQVKSFPAGFIATFAMQDLPSGWLLCNGAVYKRKDYPDLFKAIGNQWGKDGDETFKVPDFRGMFLRGFDDGRGLDNKRTFAEMQKDSIKSHTHTCTIEKSGGHKHGFDYYSIMEGGPNVGARNPAYRTTYRRSATDSAGEHTHKVSLSSTGETETRPVNATVVYAIKS
ncbi:tail fiber protein [Bartonella bilalgolemii]|uniref:Phage tail protein n=1 Tax=Bartonella bilalgolemii TaxID=2942911 RepID=A0ABT0P963_9HYPH|nr:tail fiber protein [Bartonella sp. G70]MCL6230014.1 phage tail protein [Bartonella sp. G70]